MPINKVNALQARERYLLTQQVEKLMPFFAEQKMSQRQAAAHLSDILDFVVTTGNLGGALEAAGLSWHSSHQRDKEGRAHATDALEAICQWIKTECELADKIPPAAILAYLSHRACSRNGKQAR